MRRAPVICISSSIGKPRELPFEDGDSLLKGLAIDPRVGNFRVARQARQQLTLIAVEIGPDLMAAIEHDCEALGWNADRHAEKGSSNVRRVARVQRLDSAYAVERESATMKFSAKQPARRG